MGTLDPFVQLLGGIPGGRGGITAPPPVVPAAPTPLSRAIQGGSATGVLTGGAGKDALAAPTESTPPAAATPAPAPSPAATAPDGLHNIRDLLTAAAAGASQSGGPIGAFASGFAGARQVQMSAADRAAVRQMEAEQKAYDRGQDTKKLALEQQRADAETLKAKAGSGGLGSLNPNLPTVQMGADGKPDPASQEAYLANFSPGDARLLQSVVNYDATPEKILSIRGDARKNFIEAAQGLDPTWSIASYSNRWKVKQSLSSSATGTYGSQMLAANTLVQHAYDAFTAIDPLSNVDIPGIGGTINAARNWWSSQGGRGAAALATFNTAKNGMATEFGKLLKGSGVLSEQEIKTWEGQFSDANSPAALKAGIQQAMTMMADRMHEMHSQITDSMGGSDLGVKFLKPESIAKLKEIGINPAEVDPTFVNTAATDAVSKPPGAAGGAPPTPAGAPPVAGAKQAPDGKWYVDDPARPGKFLQAVPDSGAPARPVGPRGLPLLDPNKPAVWQ